MPAAVELEAEGRFARALVERMHQLDVTIRQLAERSGLTYEHIRKLAKGEAFPSRLALRQLCLLLRLDSGEMERLAVADRLEKKYGGIPHALAGKHPELSLLEPWWDRLTEQQKSSFRIQIKSVAESNGPAARKPVRGAEASRARQRRG